MPNITKRTNKSGSPSYLIRVFVEEAVGGKQRVKSITWRPPTGMRQSAADKQAEKEAILFEEKVRTGIASLDSKTKFADYATRWMDAAEIAPKTREHYGYLLKRINQAVGHIQLEKLQADHLQTFYSNLREVGLKGEGYATSTVLNAKRQDLKLTYVKLAELCGISRDTSSAACKGERISIKSAQMISAWFDTDISKLFEITESTETLSARTIWHYHKLIRAILTSAKKSRIVPFNVASEHMDAPKLSRDEARYLNDDEAQAFLSALQGEPDIRIKTALILDMFTGLRRGELCGLSWEDIDFANNIVHVRKSSQYVAGHGVIEVPTKTLSSTRSISVPAYVTNLLADYKSWWSDYCLTFGDNWKGDKERLFIKVDGSPIHPGTINTWMRSLIKRNNLPNATPHTLRHTFATLQLAAGVDIRTLQARTGHAQASTLLNVYSHAIQSAQERAADAMEQMLLPTKDLERRKA